MDVTVLRGLQRVVGVAGVLVSDSGRSSRRKNEEGVVVTNLNANWVFRCEQMSVKNLNLDRFRV